MLKTTNEDIKMYLPGSAEKTSLKAELKNLESQQFDIPIIINGKEYRTNDLGKCVKPHDHKHQLATFHKAGEKEINLAIESCMKSWNTWSGVSLQDRIKIFRKAAELLAGPWRDTINAATMLSQSKNIFQSEIDAACELIDFFNFNAEYAENIYNQQNLISPEDNKNYLEYRPLEGFIFAITPFNFSSIAANLACAPALMGNVAIWKPASSCVYSGYFLMKMLQEAGLPDGVINFVPGSGSKIGDIVFNHKKLAGVHFTGSTKVFQTIWEKIGSNISNYESYPRIVGETGGKDFILAHETANIDALVVAMVRGAFEYQGQKCSAASRCYIPESIWPQVKEKYINLVDTIRVGDVNDFTNFVNAVIDEASFDNIVQYIEYAKDAPNAEIITGGTYDKSTGYYVNPTTVLTTDPYFKTMVEEIFGPVLTIYIYNDNWENICNLVNSTSIYSLTGAIFAKDENIINKGKKMLTHAAGNFYINDKPTGAVVGQQPFGGGRASGTNDKAGSPLNLYRWVSVRTIKENYNPPKDYKYPFMDEK
tara:strand:+ start:444 stop:2054 length:1611 start_codon:yes stop_codon:yes gene_type:complete